MIAQECGARSFAGRPMRKSAQPSGRRGITRIGRDVRLIRRSNGFSTRCLRTDFQACRLRRRDPGRYRAKRASGADRRPCGDGNFHVLLLFNDKEPADIERVEGFVQRLNRRAIAMGGTLTANTAIGQGKMSFLEERRACFGGDAHHQAVAGPGQYLQSGKILRPAR